MPRNKSPETRTDVSLERSFEQLFGFASTVQDLQPDDSVADLLTPDLIRGFARFLTTERGCKRTSIIGRIGGLVNALQLSPYFDHLDFNWVYEVLREFRIEDPEELRSRRRTKEVGYDLLSSMLEQMSSERHALKEPSDEELAWRVHDELLILWMTTFPWFPRCIREARLLGDEPNIFNLPAPDIGGTGIPPWAVAECEDNPRSTFWQFRFTTLETPNGMRVNGFLPRRLILLLEEYVSLHREYLVRDSDPGTLFLDRFGGMMSPLSLMQRVGILTERYIQKKVTPEAFRAIYAYWWLDKRPGDYDVLGGILWMEAASVKSRFDPKYRSGRRRS
jgi:integrase